MYSLLVSHLAEDLSLREIDLQRDRFLEYTSAPISVQLKSLSKEAVAFIACSPCVVMQEGRGNEPVQLVQILSVADIDGEVRFQFEPISCEPSLTNDSIWRLRTELDIEQFEFNRNHFAIKDRDLVRVLQLSGHAFDESEIFEFRAQALPAPTRPEIVATKKLLSELSHPDLDDLLLEAGIGGLSAGRDVGTRRDRADAIIRFMLANPSETTAENSLFSSFVVRKVASKSPGANRSSTIPSVSRRPNPTQGSPQRSPNRVFVVHGQNDSVRDQVVTFLRSVGLEGIVLHEQPNMGRHLLTKFVEEADLVTFAVILMTDDDVGSLKGEDLAPRARQNVILELGYFLSHLGQQRVCALITPDLETPSDFDGIVYIRMDDKGHWRTELVRELIAADMPVTLSSGVSA